MDKVYSSEIGRGTSICQTLAGYICDILLHRQRFPTLCQSMIGSENGRLAQSFRLSSSNFVNYLIAPAE